MLAKSDRVGGLPPAASAAMAAAVGSAVLSCAIILLWGILPEARASFALIALPLILMPLAVAAATWITTQRALTSSVDRAVESLERIAANELATPTTLGASGEMAALALALERCRVALGERQRANNIHASVARVMGMAIARIAEGDFAARISVELPPPYQTFRNDFNEAMERLQAPSGEAAARIREGAQEIEKAAESLRRRAAKLADRIDTDLAAIDRDGFSLEDALRTVCHTLGGAGVAAKRNIEAAEQLSAIALLLAAETEKLDAAGLHGAEGPENSLRGLEVATTVGANVLKLTRAD